jgi:3-oxoacyl-[acyl-carrier-protein] synthase II
MDLYTQYAMAAARQAMADSALGDHVDPTRLGVYFGSGIGGMTTFVNETEKLLNRGPNRFRRFLSP